MTSLRSHRPNTAWHRYRLRQAKCREARCAAGLPKILAVLGVMVVGMQVPQAAALLGYAPAQLRLAALKTKVLGPDWARGAEPVPEVALPEGFESLEWSWFAAQLQGDPASGYILHCGGGPPDTGKIRPLPADRIIRLEDPWQLSGDDCSLRLVVGDQPVLAAEIGPGQRLSCQITAASVSCTPDPWLGDGADQPVVSASDPINSAYRSAPILVPPGLQAISTLPMHEPAGLDPAPCSSSAAIVGRRSCGEAQPTDPPLLADQLEAVDPAASWIADRALRAAHERPLSREPGVESYRLVLLRPDRPTVIVRVERAGNQQKLIFKRLSASLHIAHEGALVHAGGRTLSPGEWEQLVLGDDGASMSDPPHREGTTYCQGPPSTWVLEGHTAAGELLSTRHRGSLLGLELLALSGIRLASL